MSLKLDFDPACDWCIDGKGGFNFPVSVMKLGGVETMVTVAEAKDPVATIHFLKGFKSHPVLYKKFLEDMTQAGINVVLVTLPDPGEQTDYMEDYEKIAQAVYVDGEVDSLLNDKLPRIAASHSTGSFLKMKLLTQDDEAKAMTERYDSTFSAAPFFGNKYHRLILFGHLARLYSSLQKHVPVGTTWLERQFSNAAGTDPKEIKMLANHRQALYMDKPTKALMNHIRANGFSEYAKNIRHTFMLGHQDMVSYNALSREVAKHLGAKVAMMEGGHSMVRKRESGRNRLKFHVLNTAQKFMRKANEAPQSPSNENDPPKIKDPEIFTPPDPEIA